MNVSPALAQHLAGDVTALATCWKITRRDGVVLGFTNHVDDLEGVTYRGGERLYAHRDPQHCRPRSRRPRERVLRRRDHTRASADRTRRLPSRFIASGTSHAQEHQLGAARPSRSGDHAAVHGLAGIASMDLPGTAAGSSGWGRKSDEGNAGTQSIGSAVIDVTSGDCFALTARQSSIWTKNVAAHRLFEVVD